MKTAGLGFEKPIVELEKRIADLSTFSQAHDVDVAEEISRLEAKLVKMKKEIYSNLSAWQRVLLARHPCRLYTLDYIDGIMTDFVELHGDRVFGEDYAIVSGTARLNDIPVVVFGHQKGRDTKDNLFRNFGCAHPEGYRKTLRLMQFAEKFGLPIISFIDTPGAYPGIGAEERGQAEAIARNIRDMITIAVPIIVVVIGEGGSGGALGIGVGDRVFILENAYYSVISPEGCAAILWKDRERAEQAAEALKLTGEDLLKLGIVDKIVPEPLGGVHKDPTQMVKTLGALLKRTLTTLLKVPKDQLLEARYEKFRKIGFWA